MPAAYQSSDEAEAAYSFQREKWGWIEQRIQFGGSLAVCFLLSPVLGALHTGLVHYYRPSTLIAHPWRTVILVARALSAIGCAAVCLIPARDAHHGFGAPGGLNNRHFLLLEAGLSVLQVVLAYCETYLVSHSDVDEYLEEKTSGRSGSSMELPPIGELSRVDVAPRRAPTARRTGEDSHLPSLAPTRAPTARTTGEEV